MTDKSKLSFGFLSFLHCGVLQIDGLVIYGGLKRKNHRESESEILMLKFLLIFFYFSS